ncbi:MULTISPECIES: hypothetical protein [Isoptericola]|uniref:hypothetical protein n=1 Tax=Isoptericola TaxID=254250 RepID=UPI000F64E034|nr:MULTISPECIES: hypothetical protein [Isoptericola]
MMAAFLGALVVGLAVQLVARPGREADPPSLANTILGAFAFLSLKGIDVAAAIGFLSVVAAISIAVAVVLDRSSVRAAQLAAAVEDREVYDMRVARELLQIERFGAFQWLVVLVLAGMCSGLAFNLVRGSAAEVPVGALALVVAAWMFVECLRLERVTQVARSARESMRSGEVAVAAGRQRAAAGESQRAAWIYALSIPLASGLAIAVATWPEASNAGIGSGHMNLVWQVTAALIFGAAVGVVGILATASLALCTQWRGWIYCFVGLLTLSWIVSGVGAAARVGVVTGPEEGRFVAAAAAFAVLWVVAAIGACGSGPMRALVRFALPFARLQSRFERAMEGRGRPA